MLLKEACNVIGLQNSSFVVSLRLLDSSTALKTISITGSDSSERSNILPSPCFMIHLFRLPRIKVNLV